MKIKWKIFLCLFSIVLFVLVIGLITYNATTDISYFRQRSVEVESRLIAGTNLRAQVRNQLLEIFDVLFVSGDQAKYNRINNGTAEIIIKIEKLKKSFTRNGVVDPAYKDDLEHVIKTYADLQSTLDHGVAEYKKGHLKMAQQIFIDARENKFVNGFLVKISNIIEKESKMSFAESERLSQSVKWLKSVIIFSAIASVLLALLLSIIASRSIGLRLNVIEQAAQKISGGDFDINLPIEGHDEVSKLSKAINQMALSLHEAHGKIVRQQEMLVQSSKMSSLGEMASGIAHEINTPLAVISLKIALLKEAVKLDSFSVKGVQIVTDACAVMDRTIARITHIIGGLRAFARDGASDPFEDSEVRTIIDDTLSLCGERIKRHGVDLQIIAPKEEIFISCRATQISQVLLNLLSNSFDAIESLNKKWIKIEVLNFTNHIELCVIDSGEGIAPELQKKITQPFFTTKDVGHGTGLGLSISQGIIFDHGGKFYLDTHYPNTRFVITLPKNKELRA